MKKIAFRLSIILAAFLIGLASAALWFYSIPIKQIKAPGEIYLSKSFPGKSVPVDKLRAEDRSVFDDVKFSPEKSDEFYSKFKEEKFTKEKFYDVKNYPELARADEIYRFWWLRSFHNPVVIRIYRIGDEKFIVARETGGRSDTPREIIFDKTRKLSDAEWGDFINLLEKADFWKKEKIEVRSLANDGADWEIEGVREKRYYTTGEQSPVAGEFREACIYLMRISGLEIDENVSEFY